MKWKSLSTNNNPKKKNNNNVGNAWRPVSGSNKSAVDKATSRHRRPESVLSTTITVTLVVTLLSPAIHLSCTSKSMEVPINTLQKTSQSVIAISAWSLSAVICHSAGDATSHYRIGPYVSISVCLYVWLRSLLRSQFSLDLSKLRTIVSGEETENESSLRVRIRW